MVLPEVTDIIAEDPVYGSAASMAIASLKIDDWTAAVRVEIIADAAYDVSLNPARCAPKNISYETSIEFASARSLYS